MIIIPDKLRRPAEAERDELKKQLAEARAEIKKLKKGQESDAKKIAKIIKGHVENFYKKDKLIEKLAGALKIAFEDARYTHTIDAIKEALAAYREMKDSGQKDVFEITKKHI